MILLVKRCAGGITKNDLINKLRKMAPVKSASSVLKSSNKGWKILQRKLRLMAKVI